MLDFVSSSPSDIHPLDVSPASIMDPLPHGSHKGSDASFTHTSPVSELRPPSRTCSWEHIAQQGGDSLMSTRPSPDSARGDVKEIKTTDAPAPRKRISRACDQCNQLRTKCDGEKPCAHCISFGLVCEYRRERKKRGKVSRKDLQQQKSAAATTTTSTATTSATESPTKLSPQQRLPRSRVQSPIDTFLQPDLALNGTSIDEASSSPTSALGGAISLDPSLAGAGGRLNGADPFGSVGNLVAGYNTAAAVGGRAVNGAGHYREWPAGHDTALGAGCLGYEFGGCDSDTNFDCHTPVCGTEGLPGTPLEGPGHMCECLGPCDQLHSAYCTPVRVCSPQPLSHHGSSLSSSQVSVARASMAVHHPALNEWSPGGFSLPSPAPSACHYHQLDDPAQTLRYAVLQPLLPHLSPSGVVTPALACDLLDAYFAEFTHASVHPLSSYILGAAYRKEAFFRPLKPRVCSAAMLASMLWVAAKRQEDLSPAQPTAGDHEAVCRQLLELTLKLLRQRTHKPASGALSVSSVSPVGGSVGGGGGSSAFWHDATLLGGYRAAAAAAAAAVGMGVGVGVGAGAGMMPASSPSPYLAYAHPGLSPTVLDDIATYMNLALISASERHASQLHTTPLPRMDELLYSYAYTYGPAVRPGDGPDLERSYAHLAGPLS